MAEKCQIILCLRLKYNNEPLFLLFISYHRLFSKKKGENDIGN